MKYAGAIFTSLICATIISFGSASAAEWRTSCNDTGCSLIREISDNEGTTLARLYLQNVADDDEETNLAGFVTLPLGIFIPSGVSLDVDDSLAVNAQLLECDTALGCRAFFDMTPATLDAMKKGKEIAVTVVDAQSRRTIAFNFSLMGFTKAYGEFAARM
jgi:invasion protein IalB